MYIDNDRVKYIKKTYTIYLHVAEIATVAVIVELLARSILRMLALKE